MSYVSTLKNGEILSKKPKNRKLTPYDKFIAKNRNVKLNNVEKVVFSKLKTLQDAEKILDEVLKKRGVIFEFAEVDSVVHQRTLDYIRGANYLLKGELKLLSRGKYLLLPKGMEISSFSSFKESK